MKPRSKSIISFILIIALVFTQLLTPPAAYARMRNPFKALWRGISKTSVFIIKLPDKITRPLGPVLGPVASFILTKNIAKHHQLGKIFKKAHQVRNIRLTEKEYQQALADVRQMYRDQADKLIDQADQLQDARDQLSQGLLKGEVNFDDYKQKVVDLDKLINLHDELAEDLLTSADNFRTADVVNMLGKSLLQQVAGEIKNIINQEVSRELQKLINPDIINTLTGKNGFAAPALIDLLVAQDISKVISQGNYGDDIDVDDLKNRVREQVIAMLKEKGEYMSKNWRQEVDKIIKEQIQLIKEAEDFRQQNTPDTNESDAQDIDLSEIEDQPESGQQCPSGYEFRAQSGTGCVQSDCNSIAHAHWSYDGYCVCGSSGAIDENPKDPNKECSYDKSFTSCPGCVYACVYLNQDCPEMP